MAEKHVDQKRSEYDNYLPQEKGKKALALSMASQVRYPYAMPRISTTNIVEGKTKQKLCYGFTLAKKGNAGVRKKMVKKRC